MIYKNVLIRGGTGILGTYVTQYLLKNKIDIKNLFLTGRDLKKLNKIKKNLIKLKVEEQKIFIFQFQEDDIDKKQKFRKKVIEICEGQAPDLIVIPMGLHQKTLSGAKQSEILEVINSNLTYPLESALFWSNKNMNGQIIFFSDAAITTPFKNYSAYYSAKVGLVAAVKNLAYEFAPNIRVNAIAPGIMNLKPEARFDAEDFWKNFVPLNRLGTPKSITNALEFLIKDDYITGTIIKTDGGLSLSMRNVIR